MENKHIASASLGLLAIRYPKLFIIYAYISLLFSILMSALIFFLRIQRLQLVVTANQSQFDIQFDQK